MEVLELTLGVFEFGKNAKGAIGLFYLTQHSIQCLHVFLYTYSHVDGGVDFRCLVDAEAEQVLDGTELLQIEVVYVLVAILVDQLKDANRLGSIVVLGRVALAL